MSTISITEAQAKLPELIHQLTPGEGLVITENNHPIAQLTAMSIAPSHPIAGRCHGMLTIVEDDDEHLQDFGEYMQ